MNMKDVDNTNKPAQLNFKKYHEIEDLQRQEFITLIREKGLDQGEFVVQEKVHGANLCFITDGANIRCAKRTGFLSEDEKFFNFQKVRDRYKGKILRCCNLVKKLHPKTDFLYIFGELFGGYYPHPDVPKVKNAIKLQQGIFYSPDNDFYAFDLRIHNGSYLNVDESAEIFEKIGFLYARILFRGTLDECLAYSNEFESVSLAKTFESWQEEILRMLRFSRTNAATEGFHNTMERISRVAYGFRNFRNYRLRVLMQCA